MQPSAHQSAELGLDGDAFDSGEYAAIGDSPWEYARMLRTLLGNLDGMVYRCRHDAGWTLEFVSDGCTRLTGYLPGELLQSKRVCFAELVHEEDRQRRRVLTERAIATRERFGAEYRIVRADGAIRWVWERGVAVFNSASGAIVFEGFIEDVTERKRSDEALEAAERRYYSMFENAMDGIFRTAPDGRFLVANPALARLYGYGSPRELIDAVRDPARQLYVKPEDRAEFLRRLETDGSISGFETQVYKKNREIIWISVNAHLKRDAAGCVMHYEGSVEDITERRLYQARIEHQANYDALTGLANRSLLNERLSQAIAHAERDAGHVAVAFVDLDQFKFINDSFGHQLGDNLLQTMAERLKRCIGKADTVARQGGDEFVLVLCDYAQADQITRLVQRIQAVVAEPWTAGRREFNVNCSVGIAVYPQDGRTADVLLRNADSAMYKAKENGRNNFQFFTAELNRHMFERLSVEHKLRGALARKQFLLHYQPRVNLRTGRIVGAEALLRWRTSRGSLYRPDRFISVAEDTGLIVPIGKWVLRTACEQAQSWQIQGLRPIVVSVNVSPRQFREGNMVQTVAEALEHSGLPARYLQLELTESMVMHDAEKFVSMLREIKKLGVQLAIDDFGTGYSSLSYLKRFPVDHLKIDRSFVKDLVTDPDDAAIVQAIIALGHKLGLRMVAEGVETEEQREFLLRSRCDEMQGFLFCKPLPVADFAAMLADSRAELSRDG